MSWDKFFGGLGKGAGESLGSRALGPWIDEFNAKALGIPSPNKPGAQELAAMDRMFPGTNPWERLGGGGQAGASAAANNAARRNADVAAAGPIVQANAQRDVAKTNLTATRETNETNLKIAGMQTGAQRDVAKIAYDSAANAASISAAATEFAATKSAAATVTASGIGAGATVTAAKESARATKYAADTQARAQETVALINARTQVSVAEQMTAADLMRVESQIRLLDAQELAAVAESIVKFADGQIRMEEAALAKELAKAELTKRQTAGMFTFLVNYPEHPVAAMLSGIAFLLGILAQFRGKGGRGKRTTHHGEQSTTTRDGNTTRTTREGYRVDR